MNKHILKSATALVAATLIASGAFAVSANFAAASTGVSAVVAQANDEKGVLIAHVEANGPAAKAGVRRGDILLSLDGKTVNDVQALREVVTALKPNASVKLVVDRGGTQQTLTLTTGDRNGAAYLGISLADMPSVSITNNGNEGQMPDMSPTGPMTGTGKTRVMPMGGAFGQISVTSVMTSSPAEKAGLKKGDVISAVGGQTLDMRINLADLVAARKPGDTLTLTVKASIEQDAATRTVSVTLGTNPDKAGVAWLGISYRPAFMMMTQDGAPSGGTLPQPPRGRNRVPGQQVQQGAWVASVVTNSPASKAGLVERDLITEFNGAKVANAEAVVKAVQALKVGDVVTLTVMRGTESQTIKVTLGDNPNNAGKPYMGLELGSASFRMRPGSQEGSLEMPNGMDESGMPMPNLDDLLNQLRQRMQQAPDALTAPDGTPSQGNL